MTELQPLHGGGGYRVLVVDDNPNDRALYKRLLNKSDTLFQVFEAGTVSDGLEVSRRESVDCILLDYRLPDADGIDFIRLRGEEGLEPDAAIVMVTGQGSEQTAVEVMKLGALDYIAKNTVIEGYFVQSVLNAIERSQLKRQVRQYQEELEKSYLALSDFTHTVSHDLKGPLRRIAQYCDILKEDMGDKLGDEGTSYIGRLGVNAKRLQKLVDDLLAYSRAMNSKEAKAEVDLQKIVDEVIDDLKLPIEENNAIIIAKELPVVPAHPVLMKELMQNLIENALKYRKDEAPVVKILWNEEDSNFLFSIQDNGKGIDKEYHERIFKAFERLHSHDDIEGSGLGLSICAKVVEMHNGRIWVESNPGEGSTFKFTIPKE